MIFFLYLLGFSGHPIKANLVQGISDHRDFVFVLIWLFQVTQLRPRCSRDRDFLFVFIGLFQVTQLRSLLFDLSHTIVTLIFVFIGPFQVNQLRQLLFRGSQTIVILFLHLWGFIIRLVRSVNLYVIG